MNKQDFKTIIICIILIAVLVWFVSSLFSLAEEARERQSQIEYLKKYNGKN